MKRTQRKDSFRNIRKQWVSFCSIILITLLGVTAYLGIDYTVSGMRKNVSDRYGDLNFRDIEVLSTLLLSEDDLKDIRAVKGVADVEPVCLMEAKFIFGPFTCDASAISLTERISKVDLLEGRLPVDATECLVEESLAEDSGLHIGDKITLTDGAGGKVEYLQGKKFVVTGIANHPDHANILVTDSPYVMVTREAFDAEALDHCFMKAEVVIEKPTDLSFFSKEYNDMVKVVLDRIDSLAISSTKMRDQAILDRANEMIGTAKDQVEDGFDQIETVKATLRNEIRRVYEKIFREDADRKLLLWAEQRQANADDPNETAMYFWLTENIRVDLSRPLEEVLEAIAYSESIPDKLLVVFYEVTHEQSAPKIGDAYDMEAIRQALIQETAQKGEAYTQLAEACAMWDEGHAQYLEGKAQYDEAMAAFQPCRWLTYGVGGNTSYVQLMVGSGSFANLKATFSLFFVAVAALVIFATVGKMVDEQRTLVGTTKALGFFNREIFGKYLIFGVSATLVGTLLGILTARFAISPFLLHGFDQYYIFDLTKPDLTILPTAFVVLAGVLLAIFAIWLACSALLKEPATRLMQTKMPSAKKRKKGQRLRNLSLYSRLILLNMRMDLKRVIVTIVSVAGCCALIIIGFTLRSALQGSVVKQYGEIVDYDLCVFYDAEASESAQSDTEAILKRAGAQYTDIFYTGVTYNIEDLQLGELYCGDIDAIHGYFHLSDWKTGKALHSTNRGIYIQRRMAETYHLDIGSEFEIAIGGTNTAIVRVAGVFENYIGRTMVMSREYYETLFDKASVSNAFLVRLDGADETALTKALESTDGFAGTTKADEGRSIIEDSTSMINALVLLFIFIAAVMAGVVQMNLTNMYVLQKKRELTIMRVNGFSTKEVIGYMLRETVLTTILGILFGILIGTGLSYRIVRTIEQSFLQFDRTPNYWAWLIAALMTILFTVVVNAIALRKVKRLKLTDVA